MIQGNKHNDGFPAHGLGLAVLCIAFLYVASFGPAHGLVLRGRLPLQFFRAFYVMLPQKVAWQSLQFWTRIDKGAYIEGFWFGPSEAVWRGL